MKESVRKALHSELLNLRRRREDLRTWLAAEKEAIAETEEEIAELDIEIAEIDEALNEV